LRIGLIVLFLVACILLLIRQKKKRNQNGSVENLNA
jgi:hypothetical protein